MSEPDHYYRISRAGRVTDSIRALAARAAAGGRITEFRDAVQLIFRWLAADPASFGEPFRDHAKAGQTEYFGFAWPVMVRYNVHEPTRTVYLLAPFRLARWAGY